MKITTATQYVKQVMSKRSEVVFAYIHGSILSSENPRDLDVAVFLYPEVYRELVGNGEVSFSFAIPLEMELQKKLGRKVDLQVLNGAPLSFRHRVVTRGSVVIDNESNVRSDFEYLSRVEYFDFRPRREEYMKEVMT